LYIIVNDDQQDATIEVYLFTPSQHYMFRAFHLIHDTSRQQHRWTIQEAVNTVTCSWWWAKISSETC